MDKQNLLNDIKQALASGMVSESEIRSLLKTPEPVSADPAAKEEPSDKLSAVEVMFYVAGIVLFITIMSMIAQTWDGGNYIIHILLSAGIGSGLWAWAYYLSKQAKTSDIRKGLVNSIILTGSLCVIVGGFIITNELIGGYSEVNFIPGAITLAFLGAVHIAYDKYVQKNLTILMGVFLSVASFPALLFGVLENSDVPADVWALILVGSALLLAYASRVLAKIYPDRHKLNQSFDSLAATLSLIVMFISTFGDYGLIWLILMIAAAFGLFYLSIISQNKHLLGNASFFLVLAVITISFKYFSGGGVTVSLIIATMGVLASAAIATNINKKYFKNNGKQSDLVKPSTPKDNISSDQYIS